MGTARSKSGIRTAEGEAIHHKRDGTRVIVDSHWALQRDADRAPVRILTIDSDITARKQAARICSC